MVVEVKLFLMSILEPSACVNLNCRYYANCVVNTLNIANCECPANCSSFERRAICGNDGQTYVNECSMKSVSCKEKRIVSKAYDGECGKTFSLSLICINHTLQKS